MLWFSCLEDAIQQSKIGQRILLVLVEGLDQQKTEILKKCVESLEENMFPYLISVKLEHNSPHHYFFTKFYINLQFPCLVFIGKKGVPLKVVIGTNEAEKTFNRVQDAVVYCHGLKGKREHRVASDTIPQQEVPSTHVEQTRIQFRMADGSKFSHGFESNSTVQTLRHFVENVIKPPYRFELGTGHPLRLLSTDNDDTLVQLDLHPSAVILVLPAINGDSLTPINSLTNIFWTLMYPFVNVFVYFRNMFTSRRTAEQRGTSVPEQTQRQTRQQNRYHPYGNVHTLANTRSDDSDQNTWNGNSTQQM